MQTNNSLFLKLELLQSTCFFTLDTPRKVAQNMDSPLRGQGKKVVSLKKDLRVSKVMLLRRINDYIVFYACVILVND